VAIEAEPTTAKAAAIPTVWFMLLLLQLACDPVQTFTYENTTDITVYVSVDGRELAQLSPGEARAFSSSKNRKSRTVTARDDQNRVVFEREFTWAELEELDFQIVITQ
jgi:hypothetical protein